MSVKYKINFKFQATLELPTQIINLIKSILLQHVIFKGKKEGKRQEAHYRQVDEAESR